MVRVNTLLTSLFAVVKLCQGSEPVQICQNDPELHTDACMAVKTIKSQHARGHDLLMTFSIKFHRGSGWVAFGVGDVMDRALMFVLWPGEQESETILSLRSTTGHLPPHPLKNQRQVHVHSTAVDQNGLHILQATCYSCETVGLGGLNATSAQQPWLFASSYAQQTKTSNPDLRMDMHTNYGLTLVNMAQAISTTQIEDYPMVTTHRSSIHAIEPSGSERVTGSTSMGSSINIWYAHGLILSFSVVLNCIGIVLIRSGIKLAFRGHWIVQIFSAVGLLIGCFIGVLKSTNIFHSGTLGTTHKLIGLAIAFGVPIQITFGCKHHMNYIKFGERTRSSLIHIYLGRVLFIALNLNVFLGLLHGRKSSVLRWLWAVLVSFEMLAVGTMIFAKRIKTEKGYGHVEGDEFDPFVIGDEEEKLRDADSEDSEGSQSTLLNA